MMKKHLFSLALAAVLVAGCNPDTGDSEPMTTMDSGMPDSSTDDAGVPDATTEDSSVPTLIRTTRYFGTVSPTVLNRYSNNTITLDITRAASSSHVTALCAPISSASDMQNCQVTESNDSTNYPTQTKLKIYEIPGFLTLLGVERPTDALPAANGNVLQRYVQLWELKTDCASLAGIYSSLRLYLVPSYGVSLMDLKTGTSSRLAYSDYMAGSTNKVISSNPFPAVNDTGYENITAASCSEGVWTLSTPDPETTYHVFATPSGIVFNDLLGFNIPKDQLVTDLNELALGDFYGAQFISTVGDPADPFSMRLGAPNSTSIATSNYVSASGTPTLQNTLFTFAANVAVSGLRFAATAGAGNALSTSYANGAATPGLLYSAVLNAQGVETPVLMYAFTAKDSGKKMLLGLTSYDNNGAEYITVSRIFTAIER